MGSIYDGATGTVLSRLRDLADVRARPRSRGTVDGNGRYTLGPLPAWNDYAVPITAADYRAFVSYNSGIAPPTPPPASQASDVYNASTTQTFNFDAYLFPDGLPAPGADRQHSQVRDGGGAGRWAASALRPTTPRRSSRIRPAGVTGQVWANDQDMLASGLQRRSSRTASIVIDRGRARLRRHLPGARSTASTATSRRPRPCAAGLQETSS